MNMQSYVVIKCPKCKGFLIAETNQKTKICPYCGVRITVNKAEKLAYADNVNEALTILKFLKMKRAEEKRQSH